MAGDIQRAVARIQEIAGALDGMRQAPEYPDEQFNSFPFAVSWELDGEVSFGVSMRNYMRTIRTEIHVARKDLPRDMERMSQFTTTFPAALVADVQMSDDDGVTVETIVGISWIRTASAWGGIDTLAWQFDTRVKIT